MIEHTRPVLVYRLAVVALALFYVAYQLGAGSWDSPGGPLRYLTNWALIASALAAVAMAARALGWSRRQWGALVAVATVMNAVVVIQYWRLYLLDPANVNDGAPIAWWLEYYLHLAGPLLQWIDALVILRAFRGRHLAALGALIGLVVAYALWSELFVGPMNARPAGRVTSGLPYPFLNDMELGARVTFYAVNGAVVAVLYGTFAGIARIIRPRPEAP
jgi:hypothetical protein